MNPQLTFLLSKSLVYLQESNLDAAEPLLKQALAIDAKNPDVLRFLGIINAQRQNYEEALQYFETTIKLNPLNGMAYSNLGNVHYGLRQYDRAINSYDKAIELNPLYAEAWSNKGNALYELGRYDEALTHHDRAISLNPGYAEAWSNKGLVLIKLKDYSNALKQHEKAIMLRPTSAKAWINKGLMYTELDQHQNAIDCYEQATMLSPSLAEAWSNKGNAVFALGDYAQSIKLHLKAIQLKPDYAQAWYNLAISYTALKNYPKSIECYEQALQLKPDYVMAQWNKSLVQLTIGDFHHGWQNFEARAYIKNSPLKTNYNSIPRLQNLLNIENKKILIWAEQGLGDCIQFCRYVPELAKLGADITFVTPTPLSTLMKSLNCAIKITGECSDLSNFAFQAPLMSLPFIFQTNLATIPSPNSYLNVDPEKKAVWFERLASNNFLRVGLVWNGGFRPGQPEMWAVNERRNIPLKIIARLQHINNVEFYSLQKGDPAESELELNKPIIWPTDNLHNFVSNLKDFSDTAALISNLDLVISVDTSTAHLAAALGKPTWILNRYDTCWRWLEDREDSPWYSSVKLYRQKTPGEWREVVDQVSKDLKFLAHHHIQGQ